GAEPAEPAARGLHRALGLLARRRGRQQEAWTVGRGGEQSPVAVLVAGHELPTPDQSQQAAHRTWPWLTRTRSSSAATPLLETVPTPARHRKPGGNARLPRGVGEDVGDRPLHVLAQHPAELRVRGETGVVRRLHEAGDEAATQVLLGSLARVDGEHRR